MRVDSTYLCDGEYMTINEIAKKLNVSRKPIELCIEIDLPIDTYANRLQNFNDKGSFTCPECKKTYQDKKQILKHYERCATLTNRPQGNAELFEFQGTQVTIAWAVNEYGILKKTLYTRLKKKNKSMEKALAEGMVNRKRKELYFQGREITLEEFLEKYNLSEEYFYQHFGIAPINQIADQSA